MRILAILMVACFVGLAVVGSLEAHIALVFGCIAFLGVVLPKLSVDWPTGAVGLVPPLPCLRREFIGSGRRGSGAS